MTLIEPFNGLYFDPEKLANPLSITTPPPAYISEEDQIRYYAQHPLNVVRLHMGISFPTDNHINNSISRAGKYLNRWREQKDLLITEQPALYVLEHPGPRQHPILSLLARVPLSPKNSLPPASNTAQPDRYVLSCLQDLTLSGIPAPLAYSDPSRGTETIIRNHIHNRAPLLEAEDHRIWSIADLSAVGHLQKRLADLSLYPVAAPHVYAAYQAYAAQNKKYGGMLALLDNNLDLGIELDQDQETLASKAENYFRSFPVGLIMDYWGN